MSLTAGLILLATSDFRDVVKRQRTWEPSGRFRDWPAGTHSTDRALHSETLSVLPRSHSKLLSKPAGPAPWSSIIVKATLGLFALCLRPASFKVCPGAAGAGLAFSSVLLDVQRGSQLNSSETFSD